MRLMQGMDVGGGCAAPPAQNMETLVKFISKECKNSFSTANYTCSFAV